MMTITAAMLQMGNSITLQRKVLLQLGNCLSLIVIVLLLSGCAATSNTVIDEEIVTAQKPMASYNALIIRDFDLKRELYTSENGKRISERDQRFARIPDQLAEQIKRYLVSKNIYRSVTRDGTPNAKTLILKGKFTKMGRFRISIEAVITDGATGQEVAFFRQTLWDVFDTVETVGNLGREIAEYIDRIQYK
jgi:hypothetical protein